MGTKFSFCIFLLIAIHFGGCEVINPEEEIPAYIHIDTIILAANGTGNEHALTHNFTDVWVFINDDNVGIYELPVTFPVLKSGKQELKIAAGIKTSGVGGFRDDYPLVDFYVNDTTFNLIKGEITTVTPIVSYYETINFKWIEDFENSTMTIDTSSESETNIELTFLDVRNGNFAGEINLTDSNDFFEAYSHLAYILPTGDSPIFLELDYKIEETFYIGLKAYHSDGSSSENTLVGIKPITDSSGVIVPVWKKIYIDLTFEVSAYYNSTAQAFQIGFSSIKSEDKSNAKILIDNVKLVFN